MKIIDPEMPDFLRRYPLNPQREAEIAASWAKRGDGIRRHQISVEGDLAKGVDMASLVRIALTDNLIPRLGDGPREVKCLAVGEKWARFDAGPEFGTFTIRRSEWDGLEKETLVTNLDNSAQTEAPAAAPPARAPRKKREAASAPAPEAPKAKKAAAAAPGKAKGAVKAKPAGEGAPSKKDVLWAFLQAAKGQPVSYADACSAVYGEPDVGAIGGVVIGCTIRATEQGLILEKAGKGKDATFTLRKRRKSDG